MDKQEILTRLAEQTATASQAEEVRRSAQAELQRLMVIAWREVGLTQEEIAETCGVTKQRVSQVIRAEEER